MKEINIDNLKDSGLLLYSYIRGSHAYGLNTADSDIDTAHVYCAPYEIITGTRYNYQEMLKDETNDNIAYELEKYLNLLYKANPNILESLSIPDRCILYEHSAFSVIRKNKDKFLTKQCFNSCFNYAYNQIKKCRSLNKKMLVKPCTERKDVLDFCFTTYNQGSTNIKNWLNYRWLKQEYCGCVNIPNMPNTVGVYYDWKTFFTDYNIKYIIRDARKAGIATQDAYIKQLKELNNGEMPTIEDAKFNSEIANIFKQLRYTQKRELLNFIQNLYHINSYYDLEKWANAQVHNKNTYVYSGMANPNGTSNELRLSSVSKNEIPICIMSFNKDAYSQHCKDYKEYQDWIKHRNPIRYESNKEKTYDAKNVMHSFRLIQMCIEIAQGKGMICDRSNIDRDFLLDIKNHKYEYDEIMNMLEKKREEMYKAIETSDLPDEVDPEFLNELCVNIRKEFYK